MPDYKRMYHIMFNAATDAGRITREHEASEILRKAQRECEELYLEAPDSPIMLHNALSDMQAAGE